MCRLLFLPPAPRRQSSPEVLAIVARFFPLAATAGQHVREWR